MENVQPRGSMRSKDRCSDLINHIWSSYIMVYFTLSGILEIVSTRYGIIRDYVGIEMVLGVDRGMVG